MILGSVLGIGLYINLITPEIQIKLLYFSWQHCVKMIGFVLIGNGKKYSALRGLT